MKALLFLSFTLVSTLSQASLTVEVTPKAQEQLNWFYPGRPYEQVQCPMEATFRSEISTCTVECTTYCMSKCEGEAVPPFILAHEECGAEEFAIYGHGYEFYVNRLEYQSYGNTMLMAFLNTVGRYFRPSTGRVVVDFIIPRTVKVVEEGRVQQRESLLVTVQFFPNATSNQGVEFDLYLFPNQSGIKQIAWFGTDRDPFLQQKGFLGPVFPGR